MFRPGVLATAPRLEPSRRIPRTTARAAATEPVCIDLDQPGIDGINSDCARSATDQRVLRERNPRDVSLD
jgi:hypothetical protein